MHCLIVTNHFLPETFRCNDIAFNLKQRGYEVTVLTSIPDYPEGKFHKGYSLFKRRRETIDGVKIIRVPIIPRGNGNAIRMIINYASSIFFFTLHAIYQALFHKFDCIFIHDTSPAFICIPAILIKKIQHIPIDLWILDMWPESLVAGGINNKKIHSAIQKMMDFVYQNSNMIHISSHGFRKLLINRGVADTKIKYLPNWSDDTIINSQSTTKVSLPNGFKIMFAGNLGEAQNLENVLTAAKHLKHRTDIQWIFLGDGRKKTWIENFVTNNQLEKTVHLLGRYPIEDMPSFFAQADVMLVSLTNELTFNLTLPAKVQAYMSCHKPILAFLNGEGQDIITMAKCGWCVSATDITAFIHKVEEIANLSSQQLQSIGDNGYIFYQENFSKEICINKVDAALKTLVNKQNHN